jgi:hypothetical protein
MSAVALQDLAQTYQARPIKRRRRTKGEVEQLERQILDVLKDDHPQSIRHIFYRLTNPRLPEPVAKTVQGYAQVQSRLTVMRRAGQVPYGWISDTTRRGYFTPTYGNGAEFLRRHIGAYRADLWADADNYVEVWCESRSIAGVIVDLCEELAVSLYPAGGFASISFAYEAADFLRQEVEGTGKTANIIYIGDHDPAGVLIDQSLEAELRRHLKGAEDDEELVDMIVTGAKMGIFAEIPHTIDFHFHRLAITPEQIAAYDLPTKPRNGNDRRALHIQETVEAEAMPAGILRQLLRITIEDFLPAGALAVAKAAEESEREHLRRWVSRMEGRAP